MNPAREEALFTSALEIPDRLMTDSHDKQQKLQAAPEGVEAIRDAFKPVWLAGQEQEVATLEYATARAPQAWFSPNGNNLFVYSNQTLQVYEAPSFAEIERADASQELVGERPLTTM